MTIAHTCMALEELSAYLSWKQSAQGHTYGIHGCMQAIDLQQTCRQKEAALFLPAQA